jgi:hypothetical protein
VALIELVAVKELEPLISSGLRILPCCQPGRRKRRRPDAAAADGIG